MIRLIIASVPFLLGACSSCTPVPSPVAPAPDPSTVVVVTMVDAGPEPAPELDAARLDACDRACRNLRKRGCPDGNPTPAGTSCEHVCKTDRAEPAARLTAKYLSCLASVTTCAAETSCAR